MIGSGGGGGAELLAISVDSLYSHGAWAAVRGLTFPLLADFHPKGAVARDYSVWREPDGFSERALYVLDADDVIRYSHVTPYLHHVPDIYELLEAVDEAPPGTPGMVGPPGPAYGDTISGTNLAGGIAAALLKRERTGEPSVVDVSLLGSGLWSLGHTVALTKHLGQRMEAFPPGVHGSPINPLVGLYPTADDRYISFVMMQPTKFWADVCKHMDLDELADDPRFATVESIAENTEAAAEILKETMSKRPLAEWSERFATLLGPWAPVQDTLQAVEDAQIRANEYLVQAGELELVANPVQFDVSAPQTGPAPGFAEQTDEILLELGLDWDRIIELKTAGAVT